MTGENGVESFAWRYSVFKGLVVVENRCLNVMNINPSLQTAASLYIPYYGAPGAMQRKNLTAPHLNFHTPVGIAYP